MSWRIVVVSNDAKISTANQYIIVKTDTPKRIHISEIDVLIVESNNTIITVPALNFLSENNVVTIICDKQHNPHNQVLPLYGHFRQSRNIQTQINWDENVKGITWKEIIQSKIYNQYAVLKNLEKNTDKVDLLYSHYESVDVHDKMNREGMAAKIYFKELFGKEFVRHKEDSINWSLNYAYSILAAYFNRYLISKGLILELGIHHRNEFNHFNLSYDLLEPFRPIIDYYLYQTCDIENFSKETRHQILSVFNYKVKVGDKKMFMSNAIEYYINNILYFLNDGMYNMVWPKLPNEL